MLILKNATAVQLEPAFVKEGLDIVIEKGLIKEIGSNHQGKYPNA